MVYKKGNWYKRTPDSHNLFTIQTFEHETLESNSGYCFKGSYLGGTVELNSSGGLIF